MNEQRMTCMSLAGVRIGTLAFMSGVDETADGINTISPIEHSEKLVPVFLHVPEWRRVCDERCVRSGRPGC